MTSTAGAAGTAPAPAPPAAADQAVAMITTRLVMAGLGWVGTILVARTLTERAFGQFVFTFALLGMMSVVTDLGVGRVVLDQLLPGAPGRREATGSYLGLRIVMGLLGHALAVAYVVVTRQDGAVVLATVVGGLVIDLATPAHALQALLQAEDRLVSYALIRLVGQGAQLAIVVAVVVAGGHLVWFTIPFVVQEAVSLALVVRRARTLERLAPTVDLGRWRVLLREAVPLSAANALGVVVYRVDTLLLAALVGVTSVATYGIAYKFVDLAHFVPQAITMAVLAGLVRTVDGDPDGFASSLVEAGRLLALLAVVLVVGVVAIARPMITTFYGERFAAAAEPLTVLSFAEGAAFVSNAAIAALVATGRYRRYLSAMALAFGANVALNLVLIPRFDQVGAAVATLLSEALVLAVVTVAVRRVPGGRAATLGALARSVPALVVGLAVAIALRGRVPWPVGGAASVAAVVAVTVRVPGAMPVALRSLAGVRRAR